MPIFTSFRSSMAAGGASLVAEETLITWSGTNGESKPASWNDLNQISHTFVAPMLAGSGDGSNVVVAHGYNNNYMVSNNNGSSFTNQTFTNLNINDMRYVNGKFIAAGNDGWVATSSDGNNWTETRAYASTAHDFKEIAGTGNTYVAFGNNGRTASTTDGGSTWAAGDIGNNTTDFSYAGVTSNGIIFGAGGGDPQWIQDSDVANSGYNTDLASYTSFDDGSGNTFSINQSEPWDGRNFAGSNSSNIKYWNASSTPGVPTSLSYSGMSGLPGSFDSSMGTVYGMGYQGSSYIMTGRDTGVDTRGFAAFAKDPTTIGGTNGWYAINNTSDRYVHGGFEANGKFYIMSGQTAAECKIWTTNGWSGEEVTVTFDTALASSPIKYYNVAGSSSAAVNDASLYNALTAAISAGDLSGVTVTYNNGTNNGTGVKIVNTTEEDYANISISGASSSASINTYIDN